MKELDQNGMYYKVVRITDTGVLYSCSINTYVVCYKIDEWAKPTLKGSKLFVFEYLDDAKLHALGTRCKIFKCKVEGATRCYKVSSLYYGIEDFWNNGDFLKEHLIGAPSGTILVDQAKLLEQVWGG